MDYYLSSYPYHIHHFTGERVSKNATLPYEDGEGTKRIVDVEYAQSFFEEQLLQFDTLGFFFNRPSVANILSTSDDQSYAQMLSDRPALFYERIASHLQSLSTAGSKVLLSLAQKKLVERDQFRILLCPQHLPKFHPEYDVILLQNLVQHPNTIITLVDNEKKSQWKRTLLQRWKVALIDMLSVEHGDKGDKEVAQIAENTLQRIYWMPSLKPEEYVILLSLGDVMLDQFPFGGGVTTLEALAVCTPVVTLPSLQNVPQLAAGMLRSLHLPKHIEDILIVSDTNAYLHSIDEIMSSSTAIREQLCQQIIHNKQLFEDQNTVKEWEVFLQRSIVHLQSHAA